MVILSCMSIAYVTGRLVMSTWSFFVEEVETLGPSVIRIEQATPCTKYIMIKSTTHFVVAAADDLLEDDVRVVLDLVSCRGLGVFE